MTLDQRWCALFVFGWFAASSVAGFAQLNSLDQSEPRVTNPALRAALLSRMESDQETRRAVMESVASSLDGQPSAQLLRDMRDQDEANREWLTEYLTRYSWPTLSQVGKDGAHAAWMIVQHADADREFQQKCLVMIRGLYDAQPKEVDPIDLAYLTDRVRVANGMGQLYGTQVVMRNGIFRPVKIENPEEVERRRAGLGLQSMENYLNSLEQHYARTFGNTRRR